ncbi:hypothetical protein GWK47_042248 [Chionoecetes opilio]|uniref:SWIM-type domain-containing protein n=1 Tax=Chionoecetes opilio TaxID=41210 RepID=A0A8J4YHD7_CHIOP|nr:hypothetical protein GWK47_042248 [Chionoecetes opilio]
MMDSALLKDTFDFEEGGFENIIFQVDDDCVKLRTNVKSRDDFERWRELYCLSTNTCFNSVKLYPVGERKKFHQLLVCQHGCQHQGKRKSSTGCRVTMDVTIRKVHKDSARRDAMMPSYPCFIILHGVHNHSTSSAAALRQLRVLPRTKDIFEKYFQIGMTSAQAARYHLMKINLIDDPASQANNAINPTNRAIAYMREQWLKKEHGGVKPFSMFEAIDTYSEDHPDVTLKVDRNGSQFCVALVTPFMKRIHENFREAGEVVFVDATGCVDQLKTAVIPLLCSGPVGALPLAVLFTSSLDEATLTKGFCMIKDYLGPVAFYGKGAPDCFMTDNCDAERNALTANWPTAQSFLCSFHVLQQVWRWLLDGKHGIDTDSRQELMGLVKTLVYAKSPVFFQETWENFQNNSLVKKSSNFLRYMTALVERRKAWSIAFREGTLLSEHHTNNYCEATICIIKEIVLSRCKGFNTAQLVVFMVEIFDVYMRQRLLDVALGRRQVKKNNITTVPMQSITSLGMKKFLVQSQTNPDESYDVDLSIGMCTCPKGENGAVCKHQAACAEFCLTESPQHFAEKAENLHRLAALAVGDDRNPDEFFFRGLTDEPQETLISQEQVKIEEDVMDYKEEISDATENEKTLVVTKSTTVEEKAQEACDVFREVISLVRPVAHNYTLQISLVRPVAHNYTLQISLGRPVTHNYTLQVSLGRPVTHNYTLQISLGRPVTHNYTLQISLVRPVAHNYTLQISLGRPVTHNYTLQVSLGRPVTHNYTLQVSLGRPVTHNYTLQISLGRPVAHNYTLQISLGRPVAHNYTLQISLGRPVAHNYTLQISLGRPVAQQQTNTERIHAQKFSFQTFIL